MCRKAITYYCLTGTYLPKVKKSDFYLSSVSGHPGSINVARGVAYVTIEFDVKREHFVYKEQLHVNYEY